MLFIQVRLLAFLPLMASAFLEIQPHHHLRANGQPVDQAKLTTMNPILTRWFRELEQQEWSELDTQPSMPSWTLNYPASTTSSPTTTKTPITLPPELVDPFITEEVNWTSVVWPTWSKNNNNSVDNQINVHPIPPFRPLPQVNVSQAIEVHEGKDHIWLDRYGLSTRQWWLILASVLILLVATLLVTAQWAKVWWEERRDHAEYFLASLA